MQGPSRSSSLILPNEELLVQQDDEEQVVLSPKLAAIADAADSLPIGPQVDTIARSSLSSQTSPSPPEQEHQQHQQQQKQKHTWASCGGWFGRIRSLNAMSMQYALTGQYQQALDHLERAVIHLRKGEGGGGEEEKCSAIATTVNNNKFSSAISTLLAPSNSSETHRSTTSGSSKHQQENSLSGNNNNTADRQHQHNYDEGMNPSYPLVDICSHHHQDTDCTVNGFAATAMTTICYNMGLVNICLQSDDLAEQCFLRAQQLIQEQQSSPLFASSCNAAADQNSRNSPLLVPILHNLGCLQYRKGQMERAIETFTQALNTLSSTVLSLPRSVSSGGLFCSDKVNTEDKAASSALLNCLGVVYFHLPQPNTIMALDLLSRALYLLRQQRHEQTITETISPSSSCSWPYSITENNLHQRHQHEHLQQQQFVVVVAIATTLNNIGRVHYLTGEFPLAMNAYQESLSLRTSILGKDQLDVGATLYNMGQTLHQMGDVQRALEHYHECERIVVLQLGPAHCDVARMKKSMAQIYQQCGQLDRALQLYLEALHTARAALGSTAQPHAEVASILNKLGNLHYLRNEWGMAMRMYQQGLDMERIIFAPNHPNIAVTLCNLAQIYKLQENHDAALGLYQDALDIQFQSSGTADSKVATTLCNMGSIHYQCKNYEPALEMYQRALSIQRQVLSEDCLEVASSLNSIGLVLFKLGSLDVALGVFRQSLRMRQRHLGVLHRDVAIVLYNMATIYLELGNDQEALRHYRETLRIEKETLAPQDYGDIVLTLQYIAQVHARRGEYHEALESYQEILTIQLRNIHDENSTNNDHNNSNDPDTDVGNGNNNKMEAARTLNSVADLHFQRGNAADAVDAMSNAFRVLRYCSSGGRGQEAGGPETDKLRLSGFHLYGFSKLHPECAAAA